MLKYIISVFALLGFVFNADAAVKIKNSSAERFAAESKIGNADGGQTDSDIEIDPGIDEESAIATLEEEIRILDEQLVQCKKQKKGWIAATAVGGAGVVATGITAAVQALQIKNKKNSLDEKNKEIKELKKQK